MPSHRRRPTRRQLLPLLAAAFVIATIVVTSSVVSQQTAWGPDAKVQRAAAEGKVTPAPAKQATTRAPQKKYACPGFSGIERTNPVSQLYQDSFAWSIYPPYQVGNGKGDVNWRSNPHKAPSWYMWLHSLRWLGQGVHAAAGGDRKAMARVTTLVHDWVKDNPFSWKSDVGAWESTMHRTNVLICTRQAILSGLKVTRLPKNYAWLDKSLLDHAKFLEANWSGGWNHGTDESIALFGIGCTLGREDLKKLAQQRLATGITSSIDKQGSTNEQSVGYAQFNYNLWGRAIKVLKECGADPGTTITARRTLLANWLALATDSFGRLHQLGDSELHKTYLDPGTPLEYAASLGTRGIRPTQRVGIFDAGYVFGRTGWGETRPFTQESTYSIRYGPARALHGQDDHMSITYTSHGRPILIDGGHAGYQFDKWRNWVKSEAAHNVLSSPVMAGRQTPTKLNRAEVQANSEFYELSDEPAPGMTRRRAVLVLKNPDLIVTLDRATSQQNEPFQTQWHLPSDQKATVSSPNTVVAQKPGEKVKTVLLQIPYQQKLPSNATKVVHGQADPVQGWHYPKATVRVAAPVVTFNREGRSATILSLIIPAASNATVTHKVRWQGSTQLIDLTIGTVRTTIGITPDGTLTRVK
ncbi:hypothetical protein GCM10009789_06150 [Kribbella sancticallisti]|uniref:Heparinase II/III-like protein n=1 Tax=Kribbella sancticallisti TaxID=460087 RepID=A0ABN2CCJ1_9ACTN